MAILEVVLRNDPRAVDPHGPDVRDEGDMLDPMITYLIRCGGGTSLSNFGRAFTGHPLFMLRPWFSCLRPAGSGLLFFKTFVRSRGVGCTNTEDLRLLLLEHLFV